MSGFQHLGSVRPIVALVFFALCCALPTAAAPADPFSGASPAQAPAATDGVDFNSSDWGVNQEVGAAVYTFGIAVPPGRNGMQPSLALRYSSQAPLRGGIAAGWSLDLPQIEPDLSLGVDGGTQYRATLGGASGRLVAVDDKMAYDDAEAAFRVNFDSSFTRFFRRRQTIIERTTYITWSALSADGLRHHFTSERVSNSDPRWRIEAQEDPFGNRVDYFWTPVSAPDGTFLEDRLDRIEYTSNSAAGLAAHAKIELQYADLELCTGSALPVGAAMRRGATSVDGAQRLTAIKSFVRDTQASDWRLAREVALTIKLINSRLYIFDSGVGGRADVFDCNQNLLRRLDQIDVTGYAPDGSATSLPPLSFGYNNRLITTPEVIVPGDPDPLAATTISWGLFGESGTSGRVVGGQTIDLLDIDADGVNDWVTVERSGDVCRLVWRKGQLGGGYASSALSQDLPTAAWYAEWKGGPNPLIDAREGCTIGGQIAYRDYPPSTPGTTGTVFGKGHVSYHFLDYDADGKLDLVTNVWATVCHWTYDPYAVHSVNTGGCDFADSRAVAVPQDDNEPPIGGTDFIPMSPEEVDLHDGMPGPNNHDFVWRIYKGTGDPARPFETSQFLRGYANPPLPLPPSVGDERLDSSITTSLAIAPMFDIDADGFLDFIDTGDTFITECSNELLLRECDWTVYFGDGGREYPRTLDAHVWEAPVSTTASEELETDTCGLQYIRRRATVVGLVDMTGDSLADLVVRDGANQLSYYLNTGSGFGVQRSLGVSTPLDKVQTDCTTAGGGATLIDGARGYLRRLIDLDGDGLTDMIIFGDGSMTGDISAEQTVHAQFNVGGVFGELVELPVVWNSARRLFSADYDSQSDNPMHGIWHVGGDFADVSGDGLPDLVDWNQSTISYISSPGLQAAPDLLHTVRNGRGQTVTFDYAPSSDATIVDNSDSSGSIVMPAVSWVVSAIEVDPGFGQPPLRSAYYYESPHTLSREPISGEPERASFAGFGSVVRGFSGADQLQHRTIDSHYSYRALNAAGISVAAPHGELTEELLFERVGSSSMLRQVTQSTFDSVRVFDDVQISLPTLTLSCKTVGDSESVADCLNRNDHVYRSQQQWQPRALRTLDDDPVVCDPAPCPGDPADFYLLQTVTEGIGRDAVNGDRRNSFSYNLRYGQTIIDDFCQPPIIPCQDTVLALDDYRVQLAASDRDERIGVDSYQLVGRSTTSYADASGLPTSARLYSDLTTSSRTTFTYDPALGILLSFRKAAQRSGDGGSGAQTTYSYDDHKLFVAEQINELGHAVRFTYDIASGAPLRREGPNSLGPVVTTTTLQAIADTYVAEAEPTVNFGSADRLIAGYSNSGPSNTRLDTLIKFDLTPIAGKEILWAELRLFQFQTSGFQYPITLSAIRLADDAVWTEAGATFNNYPDAMNDLDRCNRTIDSFIGWYWWNCGTVTNWLRAWNSGSVNNGIRLLRHWSFSERIAAPTFASREHPNAFQQPELVVTTREGPPTVVYEAETWQIDGLGRIITRSVTFADEALGYVLVPIEQHLYDDDAFLTTGQPTQIVDLARRDQDGDTWLQTTSELDGMGRVLLRSDRIDAGTTVDTVYSYNDLGTLDHLDVPAPHQAAGTVTYRYEYDGLARLVKTIRPDGSGVDFSFAGLAETALERTADGSGGGKTRTGDALGRVIRVEELDGSRRAATTTEYSYDANDNLQQITDADGNVTTLTHDMASARSAITRGDRSWFYSYDRNGNLLSTQSPLPQGADPALYTTSFTYDDLDRILTATYADPVITSLPAGIPTATQLSTWFLSSAAGPLPLVLALMLAALTLIALRYRRRRTAFVLLLLAAVTARALATPPQATAAARGVRTPASFEMTTVSYSYDQNSHGIGRLASVTMPLGNDTSQLVTSYRYNARGLVSKESRALTLTGVASLSLNESVERDYNALGAPTLSRWHDGQQWEIVYDGRGLVDQVNWFDPGSQQWLAAADYARGPSGLPDERATAFDQSQSYSYDQLGRPAGTTISAGAVPAVYAERSYTYSDAGDLIAVTGHSDGLSAAATFSYDALHRLTVASGPAAYSGTFSFSPAGNLLSAAVSYPTSADNRDVTYQYGATDPQAVDRLVDSASGNSFGGFDYDEAGNMIRRTVEGNSTFLTWDAAGQIRLAVTGSGSELYLYDYRGARVVAVNAVDGVRVWFNERESSFALDGASQQTYLHLSGGAATLARVENSTTIELQYADAQQNLMFALDATGQPLARFLYGAFGEVLHADGAADHRRQFNGKENDHTTGLRYYGYRYYDPLLLRWNSADPLYIVAPDIGTDDPQRLNLYSFSLNNPVRYYDPDGRDSDDGLDPDEQVCTIEEAANECVLEPDEEAAEEDSASTADDSGDSAAREVADGAAESTKVKVGASVGVENNQRKKAEKPKPSISIGKTWSLISVEGEKEIGPGKVKGTVKGPGVTAEGSCSSDGCVLEAGVELAAIEGCGEVCSPIPYTDYEACAEVCVGASAGASVSGQIGGGKVKGGFKAGVSVAGGASIRRRTPAQRWLELPNDYGPPPPRQAHFSNPGYEAPRSDQ